jgi:hypothetical protein
VETQKIAKSFLGFMFKRFQKIRTKHVGLVTYVREAIKYFTSSKLSSNLEIFREIKKRLKLENRKRKLFSLSSYLGLFIAHSLHFSLCIASSQ